MKGFFSGSKDQNNLTLKMPFIVFTKFLMYFLKIN